MSSASYITDYFRITAKPAITAQIHKKREASTDFIVISSEEEDDQSQNISQNTTEVPTCMATRLLKTGHQLLKTENCEINDLRVINTNLENMESSEGEPTINQSDEDIPDSQEIVSASKKRKLNPRRISDTDEENEDTGRSSIDADSDYVEDSDFIVSESSDSEYSDRYDTDEEDRRFDTDEEDRLMSYREPDPYYLYIDDNNRRKKRKSKKKEASLDDGQEVSIHKINLNHRKFSRKSVKNIIDYIVDKYNNKAEKKNKFKSMKVRHQPVVKPEDEEYFEGEDFIVEIFVQKVPKSISLLNSYGIKEQATTIHSLIFHYRTNELFAITTNQAWNVVQWCSDFEFPGIIAARILSKDGELESTNKGLVGTELTRKTTHKKQKKTNPYDILTFCTRFTAELRDNASILKLSCFEKKNSKSNRAEPLAGDENSEEILEYEQEHVKRVSNKVKGVKVTISLGNIRILKRFSNSDLLSILSVLSTISNGNPTTDLHGNIEQDSSAHKKYLTAVHTEVAKELNVRLSEIIHDAIANDNKLSELDNYQFCHKHTTDFSSGFNFTVFYNNNEIKKFHDEIPTIKQIVIELRPHLGELSHGTSDEDFYQQLNKVKISYNFGSRSKSKNPEKFMNFIDGLLYVSRDNSVFWHVNAMWCHIQEGYLYLAHTQFKNILNTLLLTDNKDSAYLQFRWPLNDRQQAVHINPNTKLKNYLQQYSNLEDTWSSRKSGEGIIDMIKIVKDNASGQNMFVVYYFLPGPNYKINIKCSHVAESIMQIGKVHSRMMGQNQSRKDDVAGSEDVRKQLKLIHEKVLQKQQFRNICPTFETFVRMVTEAKFILAIGREYSSDMEVPSLKKEKMMTTNITMNCISNIFQNIIDWNDDNDMRMLKETARTLNQTFDKAKCPELAQSIHQLLKQQEYIESQGNSIRGKLLCEKKDTFHLTDCANVNTFLYNKIVYKFQPRVCTVLSKLGFIELREEISKLAITSFQLIEIPC